MYKYTVTVKINANGGTQKVIIEANNSNAARSLAEMQYGKSNIVFISSGTR